MRGASAGMRIFLGKRLGIDVDHGRPHVLGDLGKRRRQGDRVRNLQRSSVRAIRLRLVSAHPVDCDRTNQYAG